MADRSSSSFTANTEKNPKEECKAVMTRSKMAIHVDKSEAEKKMGNINNSWHLSQHLNPILIL